MPAPNYISLGRTCEQYQADLAAFIDLETDDPFQAATTYPHVWWHLWTCSTCSQSYEFIHVLLDTERAGDLQPLRLSPQPQRHRPAVLRHVAVPRQALMAALPSRQSRLAVTRGSSDEGYVIYDDTSDEPEDRQFTIVVREQPSGVWQMVANVTPPPEGLLVVLAGTLRFVAPFAADGTAVIDNIAADVLVHSDAPNLEINIVPVEDS